METPAPGPAPTTSLVARMFNVFATPGEVFDEVKSAKPATVNWLIPVLLAALAGALSVLIIFSQPAYVQQMREQVDKGFDAQVQAGKMTQSQADQAMGWMLSIAKISGVTGATVMAFVRVFWWAFVLWLLGKWFLKIDLPYEKALEVAGLATMILVLGYVVGGMLSMLLGKPATLSLALLTPDADPKSMVRLGLATLDFFDLWLVMVMATGLARLSGAPWSRALTLTFGYWVALELFLIFLSWSAVLYGNQIAKHP